MEVVLPGAPPTTVRGRSVLESTLGGRFLVQRTEFADDLPPDSTSIVVPAADGDGFTQHYFDQRGVVRLYRMTFAGGEWMLLRTEADFSPLPFSQRFVGSVEDDGAAIRGRWEQSPDGATWEKDFDLVYARVA